MFSECLTNSRGRRRREPCGQLSVGPWGRLSSKDINELVIPVGIMDEPIHKYRGLDSGPDNPPLA